jgi:hypothetical protein
MSIEDDAAKTKRRNIRPKASEQQNRELMNRSRVMRLASIATFRAKSRKRAANSAATRPVERPIP